MNDKIVGRKKIREVLAMAARRRFSEPMIVDALQRMMPEPVSTLELSQWLEWNHARGWIEFRYNPEEERNEWFLTDEGKQKEGL